MDPTPPRDASPRRLSEISHLFLSDVRRKATGQDAPPPRTPPGAAHAADDGSRRDPGVDLTPEEFAGVFSAPAAPAAFKPTRAVVAHHLGDTAAGRVRDFAVALGAGGRVGVVYADAAGVRVTCVDSADPPADPFAGPADAPALEALDPQRLREALVELDQDVAQWLLVLPDVRSADTKALLALAADWTLLSAADHDGIVSAYRTLKGCCAGVKPRLSVSVFGTDDADEIDATVRKLAGVCGQFLNLAVAPAAVPPGPVPAAPASAEHCVLDAAADAPAHWPVLAGMLGVAGGVPPSTVEAAFGPVAEAVAPAAPSMRIARPPVMASIPLPPAATPTPTPSPTPTLTPTPSLKIATAVAPVDGRDDADDADNADDADAVLDLPDADASPAGILRAVVRDGGWLESPLSPPSLPGARVAVSPDRRLTLLAVARPGLVELRSVGVAMRWLTENKSLITMALPQLSIDPSAEPRLHLLVDHVDATADALQPLLAAASVTVAAYRRVRWAGRSGLLLNAA